MLVEVHVPNPNGALLPGMYARVDLSSARAVQPLLVPGDALVIRADGTQVAVVRQDRTVRDETQPEADLGVRGGSRRHARGALD